MGVMKAVTTTFTNAAIISSITSTVFIILLGFYLRRRGTFGENFGKVLTKVGLKSIFETDFKRHSEPRLPSTAQINH